MIILKEPIYVCDYCKRTLEHLYMQFTQQTSRPILFHGKFMDGKTCKDDKNKENKNKCLTDLITGMAAFEDK